MTHERMFDISITFILVFLLIVGVVAMRPWYIVDPGFSAVHTRLGKIKGTHIDSGFHWMIPLVDSITPLDMRIKKSVIKTEAFSHDLQVIDVEVAINHRIKDPELVFKDIGPSYEQTVIDPFTQESVKAVIAKFTAEELTQQRNNAKEMVKADLKSALDLVHIHLVDFNFIHADFHDDFIRAVEQKQIAEQSAKRAKFETESVKEQAIQIQARADAEAYSLKVKKEMATPQLALLKAIEKWDGHLPRIMSSDISTFLKEDNFSK